MDVIITCGSDYAVDVINSLVKQGAPFKVAYGVNPVPDKHPPPLKYAKGPAAGTLSRGSRRQRRARTVEEEVAGSGGLRAILKAGIEKDVFSADDVRQACIALGLKKTSASPNLTYFKRDGRFVVQGPDKLYTLTELGAQAARSIPS